MTAEANPQPNAPPSPGGSDAGPWHDGERAIHRRLGLDETIDPITGIDGTWLLLVVGTEALAILTSRAAAVLVPGNVAVFASFCLFLLGGAFYGMLLLLIVYRWLFLPLNPGQLNPAYWINMRAAAIATLAGARLCEVTGALSGAPPLRSFVFAATILFWSVATWWIPLLAALMLWRHGSGRVPFAYRLDNWSMVFPLGMYTTATWRLSHLGGLDFLQVLPNVFVWIALAAWGLTFIGMLRALSSARPKALSLPCISLHRASLSRRTRHFLQLTPQLLGRAAKQQNSGPFMASHQGAPQRSV